MRHPPLIPKQAAMRWTVLMLASLALLPAVGLAALAWVTGP